MNKGVNANVCGTESKDYTTPKHNTENDIWLQPGLINILQNTFFSLFNATQAHLSETYLIYIYVIYNKKLIVWQSL